MSAAVSDHPRVAQSQLSPSLCSLSPLSPLRAIGLLAAAALVALSGLTPAFGQSDTPKAEKGYRLSIFAKSVTGDHTKPDSIAVVGNHVFIAYGDGNDPAGLDGKSNKIVEYNLDGTEIYSFSVKGHNDGLKYDHATHKLWVMQNEDANPSLVVFDPYTRQQKLYTFATAPAAGGGYDDIAFRYGGAYLSASNPASNPNAAPAIVQARLVGSQVETTPVFAGNATATDVVTGQPVTLNLQDPDSLTVSPVGDLVLDSQGDSELVVVHRPGAPQQTAQVIPLSSPYGQPQVDETLFIPSSDGFLLVADTKADIVYKISKASFAPGTAYSAGVAGTTAAPGLVGRLDLEFGLLTPIVSGLQSPHGMAFVRTEDGETGIDELQEACQAAFPNN